MPNLYVGFDIGGSHISFWTVDETGRTFDPYSRIGINEEISFEELIDQIIGMVHSNRGLFSCDRNLMAIGIASPGPLDLKKGVILSPPNLPKIRNLDIVEKLQAKLNLPIFLINDADAATLGEQWMGAARGYENVVMLTLGTGVGSGVIANGHLCIGKGMGGEWGHATLFVPEIRKCSCGRFNCLESFLGINSLKIMYENLFGVEAPKSGRDILKANFILERYCQFLAEGIVNIVNVHHPECIILGGGLASIEMIEAVKKQLGFYKNMQMGQLLDGLEIKKAELVDGTIGAARHAMLIVQKFKAQRGMAP